MFPTLRQHRPTDYLLTQFTKTSMIRRRSCCTTQGHRERGGCWGDDTAGTGYGRPTRPGRRLCGPLRSGR
ncbi:hypothetical protein ADL00_13805 [Streptomyces sp. AS58]|nr:hypothetical protein ADL00_13805 [Streptomyces sp. AS58]